MMIPIDILEDLKVKTEDFRFSYISELVGFLDNETTDAALKFTFLTKTISEQIKLLVNLIEDTNLENKPLDELKVVLKKEFIKAVDLNA